MIINKVADLTLSNLLFQKSQPHSIPPNIESGVNHTHLPGNLREKLFLPCTEVKVLRIYLSEIHLSTLLHILIFIKLILTLDSSGIDHEIIM